MDILQLFVSGFMSGRRALQFLRLGLILQLELAFVNVW